MNRNTERLLTLLERELGVDVSQLAADSRLTDIADSLDWINLIAALEDEFGLQISFDQSMGLHTLQDLVRLVSEPWLVAA